MTELQALWQLHPDLRLGQLIVDLAGTKDPFHIEDDEWLRLIAAWRAEASQTPQPR